MFDSRLLIQRPSDGHHIESGRVVLKAMPSQKRDGQTGQPALLGGSHGIGRVAVLITLASLYLDKNNHSPIERHKIQLTGR